MTDVTNTNEKRQVYGHEWHLVPGPRDIKATRTRRGQQLSTMFGRACFAVTVLVAVLVCHLTVPVAPEPTPLFSGARNAISNAFGAAAAVHSSIRTAAAKQARLKQFRSCLSSAANKIPNGKELAQRYMFHNLRTCVDVNKTARDALACYDPTTKEPALKQLARLIVPCMKLK
ncbi:uncharacterized protein LOC117653710 [Thrips palmi]|uniref:Uncharacterized protein LOC117653710 n=1 Tax=Thrips palmi TaxID=161013 RepID=A0A6P9ABF7_THRPL|nr:uncharacterized protein LOC117653710 [Thrips palmi]